MRTAANRFFCICFVLFLFSVVAVTLLYSDGNVSYYENRTLASAPTLSGESLLSGEYFDGWESYLCDHAAGRTTLLRLKTRVELDLLFLPVVNDILVCPDVLLGFNSYGVWDTSYLSESADELADGLLSLQEDMKGYLCYVGLPHQYSYYSSKYPDYLENREWLKEAARSAVSSALSERGIAFVDMALIFDSLGRPDEMYSATDHHYSYLGAIETYRAVLERINNDTGLDLTILSNDDYSFIRLPNPFMGSRNRRLYGLRDMGERAYIAILNEPIPFERYNDGAKAEPVVFSLPQTETETITYNIYMGGDFTETRICTNREELPNALIFGDSFTNAAETLLYTAFNETRSLDLRYYKEKTLREYILEWQPDVVICIRDDTTYFEYTGNGYLG